MNKKPRSIQDVVFWIVVITFLSLVVVSAIDATLTVVHWINRH